jgi:hypothetical protein
VPRARLKAEFAFFAIEEGYSNRLSSSNNTLKTIFVVTMVNFLMTLLMMKFTNIVMVD